VRYVEREATYKGRPIEWNVRVLDSGSPLVCVLFECHEVLDAGEWVEVKPPRMVRGEFFVLKQTGSPNEKIVEMLCVHLGWGGSLAEVTGAPPMEGAVQLVVESRPHNGKTYFQVKWINAEDDKPRGVVETASHDKLAALDAKFGKSLGSLAAKFAKSAKAKAAADAGSVDLGEIPF
jgi:hypothetical protein